MHTKKDQTGEGNAPHVIKPVMWLYRGYTIEYFYDGTCFPYCYEVRDTKESTDTNAGIWAVQTFDAAISKVDALIKGESIRSSRAYRKGEVTQNQWNIANGGKY